LSSLVVVLAVGTLVVEAVLVVIALTSLLLPLLLAPRGLVAVAL
jgi:hypothetical protein